MTGIPALTLQMTLRAGRALDLNLVALETDLIDPRNRPELSVRVDLRHVLFQQNHLQYHIHRRVSRPLLPQKSEDVGARLFESCADAVLLIRLLGGAIKRENHVIQTA